jgi:hypothetical protein
MNLKAPDKKNICDPEKSTQAEFCKGRLYQKKVSERIFLLLNMVIKEEASQFKMEALLGHAVCNSN